MSGAPATPSAAPAAPTATPPATPRIATPPPTSPTATGAPAPTAPSPNSTGGGGARVAASSAWDFPLPTVEVQQREQLIISWRHPKRLAPPADEAKRIAEDAAMARALRRYYVEWKASSATIMTTVETSYTHCVVPFDFVDESVVLRVSFKIATGVAGLPGAADTLARSDLFQGERMAVGLRHLHPAHPLLRVWSPRDCAGAGSAASQVALNNSAHDVLDAAFMDDEASPPRPPPLTADDENASAPATSSAASPARASVDTRLGATYTTSAAVAAALAASTVHAANPVPAIAGALTALGGYTDEVLEGAIECIGYDQLKDTKLCAVSIAVDQFSPEARAQWAGAWGVPRKVVLLTTSESVAAGSHLNTRHSPGKTTDETLRFDVALANDWLSTGSTLVVLCGFGGHGSKAARTFLSIVRACLNPAKHSAFDRSLSDEERTTLLSRLMCVTFAAPMERFFDGQGTLHTGCAWTNNMLCVCPRAAAPDGVPASPTDATPKRYRGVDAELGVALGFQTNHTTGCVTATVLDGSAGRSQEEEAAGFDASAHNTSFVAEVHLAVAAAVSGSAAGDAAQRLRPMLASVAARPTPNCLFSIVIKGSHLASVRGITIADRALAVSEQDAKEQHKGGPLATDRFNLYDVDLKDARVDAHRVAVTVHPSCLLPFVKPDHAASGMCTFSLLLATEFGVAIVERCTAVLPSTMTPFLAGNRAAATSKDEPFSDAPLDVFSSLLRIEALALSDDAGRAPERSARVIAALDVAAASADAHTSKLSRTSIARFMASAAKRITQDALTMQQLIAVPQGIHGDAVHNELRALAASKRTSPAQTPDAVLQKFSPFFKRWVSAFPFLANVDAYAKKVLDIAGLLGIDLCDTDVNAVLASASGDPPTSQSQLSLATLEAVIYHHVVGHIAAVGVVSISPEAVLGDHVQVATFVRDFSRMVLASERYATAKASEATALYLDVLALWVVCHVFCGRAVEQFTRFVAVTGVSGAGTTVTLQAVAGIEQEHATEVHTNVFSRTIIRELPFALPYLLLALNLLHAVSVVVVAEFEDCAKPAITDAVEAMGALCARKNNRRQHVGVLVNKLDALMVSRPVELSPGRDNGGNEADARSARIASTAAALALEAMGHLQARTPFSEGWQSVATECAAVSPRVAVDGLAAEDFLCHANATLSRMCLASSV